MNFDWTTFALEAINFLILVWLLKRFLYRPILDAVARRQAAVARTLADAEAARVDAARLREEYEGRQRDWERERTRLRQALDDELEAERNRRLAALVRDVGLERTRQAAAREHERAAEQRELETRALQQANVFAARFLERVANAGLDARLVDVLLEDLDALPPARRARLREGLAAAGDVTIRSAHPLGADARQRIDAALAGVAGRPLHTAYAEDAQLLAGLRISAGSWELAADLAGELAAFAALAGHE